MKLRDVVIAASLCGAAFLSPIAANANGCNGVVNQLVWGCAAWDNNNGPQYPNYRAPAKPAAVVPQPSLAPRAGLVGNASGTLVGNASGTFIGNNGSALVSNAGGTVISNDGAGRRGGH